MTAMTEEDTMDAVRAVWNAAPSLAYLPVWRDRAPAGTVVPYCIVSQTMAFRERRTSLHEHWRGFIRFSVWDRSPSLAAQHAGAIGLVFDAAAPALPASLGRLLEWSRLDDVEAELDPAIVMHALTFEYLRERPRQGA